MSAVGLRFAPDSLDAVPKCDQERLIAKAEWLWDKRRHVAHKALGYNLSGFYKKRVANYRIIYTFDRDRDEMVICLIDTRDDVYKGPPPATE